MHKKISLLTFWLSLLPVLCSAEQAPAGAAAPITAVRAGKLIDVQAGRVLANQIILIRGMKIEAVGANLAIPDGAKVIDLSKMTVLPGLVDCARPATVIHAICEECAACEYSTIAAMNWSP